MPVDKKAPCIVCNKRKQVFSNKCCRTCKALVEREGTHDQYGVLKEPEFLTRLREKIKLVNKMAAQGANRAQICEKLGITSNTLTSLVYRAKSRHGIKVVNMRASTITGERLEKPSAALRQRRNEHGGGKWGIKSCKCDPCRDIRRKTRSEYAPLYQPRKSQLEAAARVNGKRKPRQKYDHGEGLTGKKNCHCDLCAPLKRAYMEKYRKPS